MATTRSFSAMLNDYLPNSLLQEEMGKRMWAFQNIEHDESWLSGNLVVPFEGAGASSVQFETLPGSTDVSEDAFVRGTVSTQPELWGTMLLYQKDIWQHGRTAEQNLLKLLPDRVDSFMEYFKDVLSLNLLNGARISKVTDATNAATGIMIVDRVERFRIGQKVSLIDDDTSAVSVYVTAINRNTAAITVSATRGGSAYNASSFSVAQNARFNWIGAASTGISSLRSSLLSSANGGGSTLYGQTKTAYPYLQAINVDGSSVTAANILDKIFDAYVTVRQRGAGEPNKCLISYKNFGSVLKLLESGKGAYHQDQKSTKTSVYGWTEVVVFGPVGALTLVVLREMDDDIIMFLDTRPQVMKIYSNGGVRKRVAPDGKEYFESRDTTAGFSYLIDICFMGDFVLQKPSTCGIVYSISY